MNYLKLFQNHTEYETFVSGDTMVRPNVSHCIEENDVHYNPKPTLIRAKYHFVDASYSIIFCSTYGSNGVYPDIIERIKNIWINDRKLTNEEVQTIISNYGHIGMSGDVTVLFELSDTTEVGRNFFYGVTDLIELELDEGFKRIDDMAFNNCTNLQTIKLPSTINSIGYYAFSQCENLQTIELPSAVNSIGYYAFNYCTNLQTIKLPSAVNSIGYGIFCDCGNLKDIYCFGKVAPEFDDEDYYGEGPFIDVPSGGTLHVPSGSALSYNSWIDCEGYGLLCDWTLVEDL